LLRRGIFQLLEMLSAMRVVRRSKQMVRELSSTNGAPGGGSGSDMKNLLTAAVLFGGVAFIYANAMGKMGGSKDELTTLIDDEEKKAKK